MYTIIDGKKVASDIRKEIAEEVAQLKKEGKRYLILPQYSLVTMARAKLMLPTRSGIVKRLDSDLL